jgi:hypothetical protein
VNEVKHAVERITAQANGELGMFLLPVEDGFAEYVLVRRGDLELLLGTWSEKRA